MQAASIKFEFLPAFHGDCILISLVDQEGIWRNILVDGGPARTYRDIHTRNRGSRSSLQGCIEGIRKKHQQINLLILTHVDDDHIGGLLRDLNQ